MRKARCVGRNRTWSITTAQKAAAKNNIKKAAAAAKKKKTIAHLPKATRTALGKKGAEAVKSAWRKARVIVLLGAQADFGAAPSRPKLIEFDDARRATPIFRPSPTAFRVEDLDLQTKGELSRNNASRY